MKRGDLKMKFSNLSKFAGASVLAASLSMAALTQPASAQSTPGTDSSNTTTTTGTTGTTDTTTGQGVNTATDNRDSGFDWGWLGLLGLAGLAGLAGKKNEEPTRYREPDEASSSTYRR
jgi:carbohydrate-binding DOMON domain-containing protein